jgi:hypothetical protein
VNCPLLKTCAPCAAGTGVRCESAEPVLPAPALFPATPLLPVVDVPLGSIDVAPLVTDELPLGSSELATEDSGFVVEVPVPVAVPVLVVVDAGAAVILLRVAVLVDALRDGMLERPDGVAAGAEAVVIPAGAGVGVLVGVVVAVVVGCAVVVVAGWAVVAGAAGFAGGLTGGFTAGFFTGGGTGNFSVCANAAGLNKAMARQSTGAQTVRLETTSGRILIQSLQLFF